MNSRVFHMEALAALMQESFAAGQDVHFSPKGVSMLPMIRQGIDTVTLSPIRQPLKKYDIPLYRRDDGTYVLHRIVRVDETYTCIGDNQQIIEPGVRQDQMIAVVTAFTRGNRKIPVDDPLYQFYARFWHLSRPVRRFAGKAKRKLKRILHIQ